MHLGNIAAYDRNCFFFLGGGEIHYVPVLLQVPEAFEAQEGKKLGFHW